MSFDIFSVLAGGDRRSIGRVAEVVDVVLNQKDQLPVLIEGMTHDDPVVRMRCADAAEKISLKKPGWFSGVRSRILEIGQTSSRQEVRWHVAQILPRIGLGQTDRAAAVQLMIEYLEDKSRIVTVSAMSALAELSNGDTDLSRKIVPYLSRFAENGTPAQRSRARKLLLKLESSA